MTPSCVSSWVQHLQLARADRKSLVSSKLQLGPQLGVRESGHRVGAAAWPRSVAACMLQSSVTCFWAPSLWLGSRLEPLWPSFQWVSSWCTWREQAWPPDLTGESSSQTGQICKIPTPHWRTAFVAYQMCIGLFLFMFGLVWFCLTLDLLFFWFLCLWECPVPAPSCLSREIGISQLSSAAPAGLSPITARAHPQSQCHARERGWDIG